MWFDGCISHDTIIGLNDFYEVYNNYYKEISRFIQVDLNIQVEIQIGSNKYQKENLREEIAIFIKLQFKAFQIRLRFEYIIPE
jgi:hypothetical protein